MTPGPSDVDRAQLWFRRDGRAAVFFGRLVPGVRTFISLPAGFSEMPLARFLLYSALGTALWTAALAYAGVLLQANVAAVGDHLNVVTDVLLAALAVMIGRRYVRCWKESRS
jgi:membrane protein DedA with SNARE-associated domain